MFRKYNSIENSYRKTFLERIKGHGLWENEFVVQEKVHGSNLSYWTTDGIDFCAAKRTAALGNGEKFYNHELLLGELNTKFSQIWNTPKLKYPTIHQMTIFGEVIGGDYPHKDITANKKAIRVQKGIYYSPDNHFFAFDIMLNATTFLSVSEANFLFEKEGLLHAKKYN